MAGNLREQNMEVKEPGNQFVKLIPRFAFTAFLAVVLLNKYGYQIPPFKETQNYVKTVLGYITIQERRTGSQEDSDEDLSGPYSQLKEAVSENADRMFSWSVTGEGEPEP